MEKQFGLWSLQTFVYSVNKNHTLIINSNNNKNIHHIHCCQKCKVLSENWATQPGKWIKAHSDSDVGAFVWKNKMHI